VRSVVIGETDLHRRRPQGDDYNPGESIMSTTRSKIKRQRKRRKSQHLVPFALVFEHDLAEEANGRHAMIEQLVVEFLQ
jgi:hypothetical protein